MQKEFKMSQLIKKASQPLFKDFKKVFKNEARHLAQLYGVKVKYKKFGVSDFLNAMVFNMACLATWAVEELEAEKAVKAKKKKK